MENLKKNVLKRGNGITLISLVVTIIVLLILAGISITMLSGDNGLLKKAGQAKYDSIVGEEKEQVELAYISAAVKKLGNNVEKSDLQSELNSSVGNNKTLVTGNNSLNVHFFDTNHNYTINDGIVTKVADGNAPEEELNIGDVITNYTSNTALPSGVNWIYFGSDGTNQYLTTSQPISDACTIDNTAEGWTKLEDTLNAACSLYIGEGATKARSITLADISRVTGFSKVESSAYTTYYFKSGDNVSENNQYNLCYPSKTSSEYWKSPTSTPEPFVTPDYSYRDASDWHGPRVTCTILGVEHTNDEITDNINVENLTYVVGDSVEFNYAVATPSLNIVDYGNDYYRAWFSFAFVGYRTVYSSSDMTVSGDSDAVHDYTWNGGSASKTENVRPIIELPSDFKLEKE